MQDPFNPGVAIGKIVLTGPAGNRSEFIAGDFLPMETVHGYMIRASRRRVIGRNEDALSDYNKALELDPKNGVLHFNKGQTYIAMKKKRMRSLLLKLPLSS